MQSALQTKMAKHATSEDEGQRACNRVKLIEEDPRQSNMGELAFFVEITTP